LKLLRSKAVRSLGALSPLRAISERRLRFPSAEENESEKEK